MPNPIARTLANFFTNNTFDVISGGLNNEQLHIKIEFIIFMISRSGKLVVDLNGTLGVIVKEIEILADYHVHVHICIFFFFKCDQICRMNELTI